MGIKKDILYGIAIAALVGILMLLFVAPLVDKKEDNVTTLDITKENDQILHTTTISRETNSLDITYNQEFTTKVESSTSIEEGATFVEEGTTLVEQGTSIIEEDTTLKEEGTTLVEQDTNRIDNGTTLIEESTSHIKETTTYIEESTTYIEESETHIEETTEMITRKPSGEIVALSLAQYAEYKHQTTGTMWNDDSSAKCTHPELLEYCESICDIWFAGNIDMRETEILLWECPVKTNKDYNELTGRWMWDKNPDNTFEVVAVNLAHAYFEGYVDYLEAGESYQQIGYKLMFEEEMAVRHFLYMKAYYDSISDQTIIYYAAVQWRWFRKGE